MKSLDHFLQRQRIFKVASYIPAGARVLDVGCSDGALFRLVGEKIGTGVGIDPDLTSSVDKGRFRLIPGNFPDDLPELEPFDVITMLAVLEHIPTTQHGRLARFCAELLKPGGQLIVTVPSALVDRILAALRLVGLVDTMKLEEHYGFNPQMTPSIFVGRYFRLNKMEKFQLGLNRIFIFGRVAEPRRPLVRRQNPGFRSQNGDAASGIPSLLKINSGF